MERITLRQLLQYYDQDGTSVDRIQIVTTKQELNCVDELVVNSRLISLIEGWYVVYIMCQKSFFDSKPILRVFIDPDQEEQHGRKERPNINTISDGLHERNKQEDVSCSAGCVLDLHSYNHYLRCRIHDQRTQLAEYHPGYNTAGGGGRWNTRTAKSVS